MASEYIGEITGRSVSQGMDIITAELALVGDDSNSFEVIISLKQDSKLKDVLNNDAFERIHLKFKRRFWGKNVVNGVVDRCGLRKSSNENGPYDVLIAKSELISVGFIKNPQDKNINVGNRVSIKLTK